MTFANAVSMLTDGRAAKRAGWAGYVSRADTATGYTLTFKNRAGTSYSYSYSTATGLWTAPATAIPFDADIMAAMVADDWTTGKTSDYEAARSGSGTW